MRNRLELGRVSVAYGGQAAVRDISLQLGAGRIGCLLGPSGCGKSSLLRAIAGFEPLAQGAIHIDEARASSPESMLPPELRGVGMVFQDCALFPHLTVGQNVAFGLRKLGGREADKRMVEALLRVGLRDLKDLDGRYPYQLSGGQLQRVALARAIAPKPRLLLIDEMFSNLDANLRERLPLEIRDILKEADITALIASNDQQEAFAMADEIGVMSAGRLLQWADAETVYQRPANRFVANFIGQGTVLTVQPALGLGISTEIGYLPLPDGGASLKDRPCLEILVRPNQVSMQPVGGAADAMGNAEVVRKAYRGVDMLYTLRLASGTELLAADSTDSPYKVGDKIHVRFKPHPPAILHMGD